jgi:hypothetical protein
MHRLGLFVLAAGCGGGNLVKGEVAGQPIPLTGGYFVQEADVFENGDDEISVVLTSLEDPCAADTAYRTTVQDAEGPETYAEAWKESYADDFWRIALSLEVEDPEAPLEEIVFDGVPWNLLTEEAEDVTGRVTHYTALLDEAYFTALLAGTERDDEAYLDLWYTDGGFLEVSKHVPNERLEGIFTTEVTTTQGDTDGQLEIRFSVERCLELEGQ